MEYKEFIDFMNQAELVKDKLCSTVEECEDCPLGINKCFCALDNMFIIPEEKFNMIKNYSEWEGVPVDTKILVWDEENSSVKFKGHFAGYENGVIYTWLCGQTSFTTTAKERWNFGELYEED